MNIWTVVRIIGLSGALLGGFSLIAGVVRARSKGNYLPMQRAFLAMGAGSLFTAAFLALPERAQVAGLVAVSISAILMWTGAVWLKRDMDRIERESAP